jgi:L-lysine exporter family protein LysE/ArgO
MITAAVHGFLLSFGLILPLGVQNIFIFNQGATQKHWVNAIPAVLTAAVCDTLLISLAVFGVTAVGFGFYWIKTIILIIGILFLVYMGYSTWKSKPNAGSANQTYLKPGKQIVFSASVSLLNPHAIMDTIGVIGTSSLSYSGFEKTAYTLACIFVSWLWFFGLSITGRLAGTFDTTGRFIHFLNKVSALIMWGTACYLVFSL